MTMITYAAYCNNENRINSSSGGMFSVLAQYVLASDGVVYGVAMSDDCKSAVYKRVADENSLHALRGSKYIQAEVGDTFKSVKVDLEAGKLVLFSGMACQINGLHGYLQKNYQNLICVDIICHGVPSVLFWQKFIGRKQVKNVNFRCKNDGWVKYGLLIDEKYIPADKNKYMQVYLQNHCLRPSCYECVSKQNKKSDITIGDFWGIDRVISGMNDDRGVSVVICRTENGCRIFNSIKSKVTYKEVPHDTAVEGNPCEFASTSRPERREEFWIDFRKMSFNRLYKKYVPQIPWKRKIKITVKKFLSH